MKKTFWLLSIFFLLVTCIFLFNYFYSIEKKRKIEEITEHQKILANQAVKNFREAFKKWNSVLFYLSDDENIILMNEKGKFSLMRLIEYLNADVKAITRTDKNGNIIFTVPYIKSSIGANISRQKHMARILSTHEPVMSDVFEAVQGYKAIVIHHPVFKEEKYDGSIAILLNFEQLSKNILDDIKIGNTGYAWMLSEDGIELYCPIPNHVGKSITETSQGYPELENLSKLMLSGESGTLSYSYNQDIVNKGSIKKIAYYTPIQIFDTFWALAITYSENEITASLVKFRNKLILIFILVFIGGAFLSYSIFKVLNIIKESALRKIAEAKLERERTLLRTLIDNLPSGVFVKDTNYKKILANKIHINSIQSHLKHLGLNPDINILNKTDFEIFPADKAEKHMADEKRVIENGEIILNQEESGIGPDGSPVWLLISKVPIFDSENKIIGMVGISTDITNKKKTEEQLIFAKEKAEESDRLKTAFLNNISHEIRTPLNAVLGFTQLLNEPDVTNEKIQHYTQIIHESGNQLLMIISDIINIATIEAGQLTVTESKFPLNNIFSVLKEQFKWSASQKNIELSYDIALPHKNDEICTDYIKLVEILTNLINNAIKFTENGYITYGYKLINNHLEFFVKDTGIGIKPEFQQLIFDRFFQVKDKSNVNKGTGLGLSIAMAYVKVLGGKIWLNSNPGEGSTFYFTIPYKTE